MTGVTRWWWVRHAPVPDHDGRLYGRADVSADVSDRAALAALARLLPGEALWLSSPLRRARETAEALAEIVRADGREAAPIRVEPDFAEQDFGAWQGRSYAEIEAMIGPSAPRVWLAPASFTPPGGESFAAMMKRVEAAIERLSRAHSGRDIIAVSHAGTVRAALGLALRLDPEIALRFVVETLSLTRLDHLLGPRADSLWRVVVVNERAGA